MAMITVLSAVVERLRCWFDHEEGISCKLIAEHRNSLLDILGRLSHLLNSYGEAGYNHMRDENFQKQVKQLGKIVYRMENLVESHQVDAASRDKLCMMRSILKRMSGWMANPNFRAELNSLTDQINDISVVLHDKLLAAEAIPRSSDRRDDVGGPSLPRTSTSVGRYWDGDVIISREDDEENLVSALIRGSTRVEVVSICGMAGIGKTCLARKLFTDPAVEYCFFIRVWITVTQEFTTRDIFLSILRQTGRLSALRPSTSDMELAALVYESLRSYWLVVLDDVWSIEVWESIKLAFPDNNKGSRILVTTRLKSVASFMSGGGHIHDMSFLDDNQSWELFKRRAQLTDSELDPANMQIAKKIVTQCGGLPLTIVVLAGILRNKSFHSWKSLLRDGAVETHAFESLTRPLDLSYNSLPSAFKPCLLYMGTFPRGSKIEADTMCQLWIAEGLVSENGCGIENVMEFTGNCFDELASRNLVQVPEEEMSTHQSFRYGCLHDLVRDFCILKAKEEEFFEVVKLGHANQPKVSAFRCAIYLDKHEKMDIHPDLRFDLRSLLFFNLYHQSGEDLIRPCAIPDLSNLKWIRTLHFEGVDFKGGTLPPGVENLILLRYLSLKDCYLEKLPPYIGNFIFLTTLDLRVKKWCKVIIPNVLCKLQKLRHLYLPLKFRTPNHDNLQLDDLKELEILENFDTGICNAREIFKPPTRLRHLTVSSEGNLEVLEQILECIEHNVDHWSKTSIDIGNFDSYSEERLSFIEKLFSCRVLHILRLEGRIGKMPELGAASRRFTELHLNGSQLEDDPMRTLWELPYLRILVLECEAYIGKEMYCSNSGFRALRSLKLSKLYNLESWKVEEYAMPYLSTVTIENCRRMKKLPEKLGRIEALRKLKINMMSKEFVGRLLQVDGKGGEDFHKIKCTIEFGSDNLWPESTDSIMEQNNSFEDKFAVQISSSTGTRDFASSSAYPPPNEWERDVYLQ